MFQAHLERGHAKPLPVVIIGNGPSGICLSYLLSGHVPYVRRSSVHPNPILQRKLEEMPEVSILDQDLEYFSEGLEGRSSSQLLCFLMLCCAQIQILGGRQILSCLGGTNPTEPFLIWFLAKIFLEEPGILLKDPCSH